MKKRLLREANTITLTRAEALVLSDWLAANDDGRSAPGVGPAEWKVLNSISCQLEEQLVELFWPEYAEVLEEARADVVGADEVSGDPEPEV